MENRKNPLFEPQPEDTTKILLAKDLLTFVEENEIKPISELTDVLEDRAKWIDLVVRLCHASYGVMFAADRSADVPHEILVKINSSRIIYIDALSLLKLPDREKLRSITKGMNFLC